ncbi:MAG: Flp pilus assembly protein CpaB [Candidatus Schekmanbacteria bacterium]|nr:Flp pilus assembly protein CpaB [Candidatus Schekmanbacteria bacterium]
MKSKQGLLISIMLGLIVGALIYRYIGQVEKEYMQLGSEQDVLVATRDILQYERVDDIMVKIIKVPAAYIQPGALKSEKEAVGQVTSTPMLSGEQILKTKLFSFGLETGLALKVPPGYRALSLVVNDVTGVAGLVRPGNYVDIFGTFQIKDEDDRVSATELLLQNILVLAVERRMSAITPEQLQTIEEEREAQEKRGEVGGRKGMGKEEYPQNLTLAVLPEHAGRLITAQDSGVITVVLRSQIETEEEYKLEQITTNKLLGKGKLAPRMSIAPQWQEIRGTEQSFGGR